MEREHEPPLVAICPLSRTPKAALDFSDRPYGADPVFSSHTVSRGCAPSSLGTVKRVHAIDWV
eukprot:1402499-Rhodomonas_salina.1